MAITNYTRRLENLQARKYDEQLNESHISKSFSTREVPENLKYLIESTRKIEDKYNDKTKEAARLVQKHLEEKLSLHFSRAYRTQGSVITETNIKVHSDFDLLTLVDKYTYLQPTIPNPYPYTDSVPRDDLKILRSQAVTILKSIYDEVDDSGEKCVSIFNKNLVRKVDVVFGFWYDTEKYREKYDEYYRGVKFKDSGAVDFPFAHLRSVNNKGNSTLDGSRKAIRLLKNLKADSDSDIDFLRGFHFTSAVHSINNTNITSPYANELHIAKATSAEFQKLLDNSSYRAQVKSPNGTENPFTTDDCLEHLQVIKDDLDELIKDCTKEIASPSVQKALLTY